MLEQVDLARALSKQAYQQLIGPQVERLYELQQEIFNRHIPMVVLFEGWDAAGKGTMIRKLTERLDPRGFKVLATQAPRTHENQKPWLWRFWMEIPRRGQMAIFDRSWYGRVVLERVEGYTPIPDWIRAYEEINGFERTLADDGTILCKVWLHINKEEQLKRFVALTQNNETAWQVTAEDWERHRKYDEYLAAVRDMLANTHTAHAPWSVVPSTDLFYKTVQVFRVLIGRLEAALELEPTQWPEPTPAAETKPAKKTTEKKATEKKDRRKNAAPEPAPTAVPAAETPRKKGKKKSRNAETGTPSAVNGDRPVHNEAGDDHA